MRFLAEPDQGYILHFNSTVEDNRLNHVFCGSHEVPGAICPNCNKKLQLFLSLDCDDKRLNLSGISNGYLRLFYCWRCALPQDFFFYSFLTSGDVAIISFRVGSPEIDFPYVNYPDYFPGRKAILEELPSSWQKQIVLLNENRNSELDHAARLPNLEIPLHQIGGIPILFQYDFNFQLICPNCSRKMPFLACIANTNGSELGFAGNDFVQVIYHFCRRCLVVGAYQACD